MSLHSHCSLKHYTYINSLHCHGSPLAIRRLNNLAQVTQSVSSKAGTPNRPPCNAALKAGPGAATPAERREPFPQGVGARVARARPASAPAPNPACPRHSLLDLQRGHLPLFVELVIEGAHDVGRERREVLLGVHGGNSGCPPKPRDSSARDCPGCAGDQGSLRLRAASGAGAWATPPRPACLAPPRAPIRNPGLDPAPVHLSPATHTTSSSPAPAALKGQRPCYTAHVTPQPLPPSASRPRPSPATPPRAAHRGLATPPRPRLLLSLSRLPAPLFPPLPESGL